MNTLWLPLLLSSVIWAEEQYFPQLPNATWDEARLYCQSCFKELTTITSRNVHVIVKNLSSDYWLGLRRRYNGSFAWAAWSNGDPVTYQNWYPGHPVPNKEKKLIPICSSTTESPLSTVITTTTATLMTSLETSTVTSAPVTFPKTSTMFQTEKEEDTCPILIDMLNCLNMTCYDLESVMTTCNRTTTATPKTTTYNTTPEVTTFSTTFNATTTKGATTEGATTEGTTTESTTTEGTTTEGTTTEGTTTEGTTTESTTTSNCIFEPKPDPEQYIEDACVVLLSFGMWKEEDCNKSLPYICYEERFFGQIYVSDVNTSAGNLSWTEGPGAENISHYRVEITGDHNQTFNQTFIQTDLFEHIQNLTAGTLYRVQVFPVKCGRDLNPQNISFYTQPSDVQHLTVVGMTTVSAYLSWSKPEGNREFYSVTFINELKPVEQKCDSEVCNITGLIPGTKYEFTVKAVVNKTLGGISSNVSDYTIPSTVRKLKQSEVEETVITASWDPPTGSLSGYRYCLKEVDYNHECTYCNIITNSSSTTNSNINTNSSSTISSSGTISFNITDCNGLDSTTNFIKVSNKSDGCKFCLCVAALTKNDSISGEKVAISAYTRPKNVTSLSLSPDYQSMYASWKTDGKYEKFEVTITTDAYNHTKQYHTTDFHYNFPGLKAGVNYTVSVVTLNGHLRSGSPTSSSYTRPAKPAWIKASTASKTTIELSWGAPTWSGDALINYTVEYHTPFWNEFNESNTTNTKLTISNLRPGTRYDFNVRVVAGNLTSDAATAHNNTNPEKRTLVLTMLCSSKTPLHCDKNDTRNELFKKLETKMNEKIHDWVHWNLKFVNRSP